MYTIEDFRKRFQEVRIKACWQKRYLSAELKKRITYIGRIARGEEDMTMTDFLRACEIMEISPVVFFDLDKGDLTMEYERLLKKTENMPNKVAKFIKCCLK